LRNWQAEQAANMFGVNEDQLVKSVRMAEAYGFTTASGKVAWQPYLALKAAAGIEFEDPEARGKSLGPLLSRQSELMKRVKAMETSGRGSAPAYAAAKAELERINEKLKTERAPGVNKVLSERRLAAEWKSGLDLYNSETLAFFHVLNPGLASRMQSTPAISIEDARLALSYMADAGLDAANADDFAKNMLALGFADPYATEWAATAAKAAAAGSAGGRTIMKPDPVAIRQATKDLYRQMYLEDPSEQQLDKLSGDVTNAIMSAPDDVNVDGEARLREVIEGDPKYQEYYGNKPAGVSEEDYQRMFVDAQRSMLGSELAGNTATKVGMKDGRYQTAVGATLGLKQSWDNSTFMGRLAQAAEAVNRNT
jgi:hypothetical protein